MALEGVIAAVGWFAAGLLAWWQLRAARSAARVQRTIDFHEVLTTGEVGAARDRFATLMWFSGEQKQPGRCNRPSFGELLGATYSGGESGEHVDISAYPPEVVEDAPTSPMQDLYRLLWTFERIEAAEEHGLVDLKLTAKLLDHHFVWWDALAREITVENTRHRRSLQRLASDARSRNPSLGAWASSDFIGPPAASEQMSDA